ncbi:MAG TPA: sulfite exporter TauE/SafE family protein [Phycisphaerales bacterium]|nr:sulfite exporter TauE/SafE family protein [Phycisphaerales bacterium]
MIALVTAIFLASVLGSLHCAGMCGAFLAIAVNSEQGASKTRLQIMYHSGRLLTYAVFGACAGGLGLLLDAGGVLIGMQRMATVIAGFTVATFGVLLLLRSAGMRTGRINPPKFLQSLVFWGHRVSDTMPASRRALVIGLLTAFLPCGWLWAFVITAAGTGSVALGALCMFVFWLGTLPVMVSLGAGIQSLSGWLGRKAPLVTACVLVACGLWTVSGRWALADVVHRDDATLFAAHAEHSDEPATVVESISSAKPSCCQHE